MFILQSLLVSIIIQTEIINKMKPKRPDSAKSAKTRITVDSDASSNNITQSRFSETYSNGVKLNANKNNQFEKYVSEKNKDPRFKKFLQPSLPEIPEQLKPSSQLSKLTSKPFEKKTSKIEKDTSEKKVEEAPKPVEQDTKGIKKQNLQSSATFIDKSKRKLKLPSRHEIEEHHNNIQENNQNIENEPKPKPKINLNGFVLNIPGKAPQVIKQEKVEQKAQETKQAKEKKERDRIMTEISEYVQEMEDKNYDYLPKRYDEFVQRNLVTRDVEIEKINIEDFLEEPNEKDYDHLMRKINENQQRLQSNEKPLTGRSQNNSSASINLEEIIDGSEIKKQDEGDDGDDNSVIMSSMSASDVRDRNMFLTQILKGKRITQQELSQIKENNDTIVKLIKLEGANRQQQLDDDDIQLTEINMSKKKSNRIMQRNKLEAAGDLYRQCDYLTEEERQRIDDLINGVQIDSPFELTEAERFMSRRIDEGIKIHRQLCGDYQSSTGSQQADITIDESTLPKDPILRKKAQLKILRQKINSVNCRLASMNQIVVNKTKIQSMIAKYKEMIKPSKMSQSLIVQKRKQIEQQCEQLRQAQEILKNVVNEKDQILRTMQEMVTKYASMQAETNRVLKMDAEQLRKLEQSKLKDKRKKIEDIENDAKEFEAYITGIEEVGEEIKRKMQVLDQIMAVSTEQMKCQGYRQGETIEDLDELITRRWQDAEEAVRITRQHDN